jgi:hypothetical protein
MAAASIFQLKITLRGSRPPIWRRVLVPGNVTLLQLHGILQQVMGWTDSHLHQFRVGEEYFGSSDLDLGEEIRSEQRTRLNQVLSRPKDRMSYEYDFGDGWDHLVVLEKVLPSAPGVRFPMVVAGARACPPEDVGGIAGYEEFLEAIGDPLHPDHAAMVEWAGGDFDPEAFDVSEADRRFHRAAMRIGR